MYHGDEVPGFPQHPHRGFETVTIVRRGLIDHADSLGAAARFGRGDVQWLTAGKGIVHCGDVPAARRERANPLELFQIWLNLPARDKMVDPHFTMLWTDDIPSRVVADDGRRARPTSLSSPGGSRRRDAPPSPPPDSWAARPDADVAIWTMRMAPGARWTLPAARRRRHAPHAVFLPRARRSRSTATPIDAHAASSCAPTPTSRSSTAPKTSEILMLQGRPIGEPVAQHGPFVMNTRAEIQQAFADYQRTPLRRLAVARRRRRCTATATRTASRGTPTARWTRPRRGRRDGRRRPHVV